MAKNVVFSLILFSSLFSAVHAVTLTYNLKIRRIFNIEPIVNQKRSRLLVSAVPIFYARTSHIVDQAFATNTCEDRKVIGSLFNLRYVPSKNFWLEATTGLERDHAHYKGTPSFEHSRFGLDDLVLSAGGRAFLGHKVQVVGYGLMGIPLKTSINECDKFGPFVGSRIYNVGAGAELSYSFIDELPKSFAIIAQGRFIHGFDRSWDPILPKGGQIQPGNVTDFLLTLQYRQWRAIVEGGYNATQFSNQALILPLQKITSQAFVRHSWYATLSRATLKSIFDIPAIYGVGFNYSTTRKFDAKTLTGWVYFTLVF